MNKSEFRYQQLQEESVKLDRRPKEPDGAGVAVRVSAKEVCRSVKTRQQLANTVNDHLEDAENSPGIDTIAGTLRDLKKIVRVKLCTTVEQEETKNENIAALTTKAKDAAERR